MIKINQMISAEDADRFANCDGKICGLGRHVGGGNYICPHNNLKVKRPDLMHEWDFEKNTERPETLTLKSHKLVWWICSINPCGCHKWNCKVQSRTNNSANSGCPYCCNKKICIHNSLYATNSPILLEWDYERNKNLKPWKIAPMSNKEIWWQCLTKHCGCHFWEAKINSRMRPNNGCPYCSGQRTCIHNSLYTMHPKIAAEWDYEKMEI